MTPKKTVVGNINKLTKDEKDKVIEEIKKVNPNAKIIEVKDNGDSIIRYKDGTTNTLQQKVTVVKLEIINNNQFKPSWPNGYRYYNNSNIENITKAPNKVEERLIIKDRYAYIVGYANGNFGPTDTIKRAEVAAIFARLSKDQRVNNGIKFTDVNKNDWFNKSINIGVSQGIIKGYEDGTFRPNKPITRAEFASVISNYANNSTSGISFNDVSGWSSDIIDRVYANGWMKGNSGSFRPNDPITRAEAVAVINRMLNRRPDKTFIDNALLRSDNLIKFYKDVNPGQWFFYDVYTASWGYNYTIQNGIEKWTELNYKMFTLK